MFTRFVRRQHRRIILIFFIRIDKHLSPVLKSLCLSNAASLVVSKGVMTCNPPVAVSLKF